MTFTAFLRHFRMNFGLFEIRADGVFLRKTPFSRSCFGLHQIRKCYSGKGHVYPRASDLWSGARYFDCVCAGQEFICFLILLFLEKLRGCAPLKRLSIDRECLCFCRTQWKSCLGIGRNGELPFCFSVRRGPSRLHCSIGRFIGEIDFAQSLVEVWMQDDGMETCI